MTLILGYFHADWLGPDHHTGYSPWSLSTASASASSATSDSIEWGWAHVVLAGVLLEDQTVLSVFSEQTAEACCHTSAMLLTHSFSAAALHGKQLLNTLMFSGLNYSFYLKVHLYFLLSPRQCCHVEPLMVRLFPGTFFFTGKQTWQQTPTLLCSTPRLKETQNTQISMTFNNTHLMEAPAREPLTSWAPIVGLFCGPSTVGLLTVFTFTDNSAELFSPSEKTKTPVWVFC